MERIKEILEEDINIKKIVVDQEIERPRKEEIQIATGKNVIDRFDLILTIFEKHMSSPLGKAQLEYIKTKRRHSKLRMIDTISPHERHRARTATKRLSRLSEEIEKKKEKFQEEIDKLMDQGYPSFALTGYTNAGKSTLFNALLKKQEVEEAKRLFTTLKTTARPASIQGRKVMFVDTVGFFEEVPHELLPAFESTLYAARKCDYILILIDASRTKETIKNRVKLSHKQVTKKFKGKPLILLNKIDKAKEDISIIQKEIEKEYKVPVYKISAKKGKNIEKPIQDALNQMKTQEKTFKVPYKQLKTKSQALEELKTSPLTVEIKKGKKALEIQVKGTPKAFEKAGYLISKLMGEQ